jgi:poly(3-hydroxyalkanoate) synthetase
LFLLAARDDDVVAPEQLFATEHLVDSRSCAIEKVTAPCGHLGLFMGREILADIWPEIARWLAR